MMRPSWRRFSDVYTALALVTLNTLVLLIALEVTSAAVGWLWPVVDRSRLKYDGWYYTQQPWGVPFLEEADRITDISYVPFVVWKTKPFHGRYVRIDSEGNRETPGAACGEHAYRVYVFGGSTVWGDGVPDWGTIPAYLQAKLQARDGRPLCVRNFGQPGWISTQGVIELEHRLQIGEAPDLVIFYDGFNEVDVPWDDGFVGAHANFVEMSSRLRPGHRRALMQLFVLTHFYTQAQRLVPALSNLEEWPLVFHREGIDEAAMNSAIVHAYLANLDIIKALARERGFEYAFFWQPNLRNVRRRLTPQEQDVMDTDGANKDAVRLMRAVYDALETHASDPDHLYFIADALEKTSEPVYLDSAHLTHVGNQAIAARMMEILGSPRFRPAQ